MDNEVLAKSLVELIDDTLNEIEELKKSKFSAAEIKIEGPGDKEIAGKPSNGELDAKKAEDKDEDKDDDDKDDKDEKKVEIEKAEDKKEDKDEDKDDKDDEVEKACSAVEKMEEKDKAAMYKMFMAKKEMEKGVLDEAEKAEKSEKKEETPIQKVDEDKDALIKSYVDKVSSLEGKINEVQEMITKIGEQPVERQSVAAGAQVTALKKSEDEVEPLSKSEIGEKMFELKKSGEEVSSFDFAMLETGSLANARTIADKYGIK